MSVLEPTINYLSTIREFNSVGTEMSIIISFTDTVLVIYRQNT